MLAPVLASGRRAEREIFDASAAGQKRKGDLDLKQVGRGAKMPWQTDGRRWHTCDRVSHTGRACRWEGAALERVIDAIESREGFAATNWNDRSVIEVTAKSGGPQPAGTESWFLHALTGDEWLLTLKFRVRRNTFKEDDLLRQLDLKPFDDLDDLPVYGRGERVRVKNLKGPYQEVTVTVHWLREIDTPEFRRFLEQACESHLGQSAQVPAKLDDLTPWKVLGRKWHLSRKGFPSGKRVAWNAEALDQLFELLIGAAPNGRVEWGNKQVVYVHAGHNGQPWAAVHTKRRGGIDLQLFGRPGAAALGQIAAFGAEREISLHRDGREAVCIRFTKAEQIAADELRRFLEEHRLQG